jgi:hypothetical protein
MRALGGGCREQFRRDPLLTDPHAELVPLRLPSGLDATAEIVAKAEVSMCEPELRPLSTRVAGFGQQGPGPVEVKRQRQLV